MLKQKLFSRVSRIAKLEGFGAETYRSNNQREEAKAFR
jgi:hypothetical protein